MPHLVVYEYTLEYAPARHPRRHDAVELRAERRERVRQHLPRLRQPLLPLWRVGHRNIAVAAPESRKLESFFSDRRVLGLRFWRLRLRACFE